MAASSETADVAKVEKVLAKFIDSTATDKTALKGSNLAKCFDQAGLTKYKPAMDSSGFPKNSDKAKKCSIHVCATKVLNDTAAAEITKKKPGSKPVPSDDPEVVALANTFRSKIALLADVTPAGQKQVKTDKTTERLTNTAGYTGSHKERFDESGKGKGKSGRVDQVSSSGYVGNYKGEGTYEKK